MSLLSVCTLIPQVLLSFIAGSISDSWNKKKIMMISDSIAAVFSMVVIVLLFMDELKVEYLYVINFMIGTSNAFQYPASDVTVSLIVSKENYIKTSGLRSLCNSCTGIFAPIIATSLYAFWGLKTIVLIDLTTFIFAFTTLGLLVKIPQVPKCIKEKKEGIFKGCILGIEYLIKQKNIFRLILFMAFVNFIAAIYNTNLAPMVLSRNGNNDVQLGIVSSTISIAGVVGSILVAKMPEPSKRIPLILNIMTFSFLFCNGLLGIGQNYYIWTFAVFMGNVLIPFLTANVEYIMRTKVPLELQGRVFSARNTLQYTSIPVGNIIGGFLADKIFEPYMKTKTLLQSFLAQIVGNTNGSGIGLLFICLGVIGFLGCCIFRLSKSMRTLDYE
jgi:MFS family permease